jgi:hypothetical protein
MSDGEIRSEIRVEVRKNLNGYKKVIQKRSKWTGKQIGIILSLTEV